VDAMNVGAKVVRVREENRKKLADTNRGDAQS
jgi:hypothetical protein